MRRYLFIYYKINDLRSKTMVNVCMYKIICVGACVFILCTTTPDKNKNTGKIQNRSGKKKKYFKKNKIHSVKDGICRVNDSVFIENPLKQLAHNYLYNNRFLTSFIIVHATSTYMFSKLIIIEHNKSLYIG